MENLAKAVEDYRDNKLGMNKSFQDCGVDEDYFWSVLDQIGMRAYEDQCTPANPRIPLINDMKDIAVGAYYGVSGRKATSCASSARVRPPLRKLPSVDCRRFVVGGTISSHQPRCCSLVAA